MDTHDSSTTPTDAYSAPLGKEEEEEMAPIIASTQMDIVIEESQETADNRVEPPTAAQASEDPYVFVFPDEEEELEMFIREEAPKDLERWAAQNACEVPPPVEEEEPEVKADDADELSPLRDAAHHQSDEAEGSDAETDVEENCAAPRIVAHYRLEDEEQVLAQESDPIIHDAGDGSYQQDEAAVVAIDSLASDIPRSRTPRPTSINLPPRNFIAHNYEREGVRNLEEHLILSQNAPPRVIAELENPPRRAYEVPDGAEPYPYWAPYENRSLIPESTSTSPEICLWSVSYHGDVEYYATGNREWWDNTQGAKLHDNMRRLVLSTKAWSHVYAVDSTVGYKVPYSAMNRQLAEDEYTPGISGIGRKWWYKPGAKGLKESGDSALRAPQYLPNGFQKRVHPENATARKIFWPQPSRLSEAHSAADGTNEDSYVSTSDFDQTPAEGFRHVYAGLSQDILDGGDASDSSDSDSQDAEDDDATEDESLEAEQGSNIEFVFDDDDTTSQFARDARAEARSGLMNGRQSRFGRRDEDLEPEMSDTESLEFHRVAVRSVSAPPTLGRRIMATDSLDFGPNREEDGYLLGVGALAGGSLDESADEYGANEEPTFGDAHIVLMQRQGLFADSEQDEPDSSIVQDKVDEQPQAEQKPQPKEEEMTDGSQDDDAVVLYDLLFLPSSPAPVQRDATEDLQDSKPDFEDVRLDSGIGSSGSVPPNSTPESSFPVNPRVSGIMEAAMNAAFQHIIDQSFSKNHSLAKGMTDELTYKPLEEAHREESEDPTATVVADVPSPPRSQGTTPPTIVDSEENYDLWLIS